MPFIQAKCTNCGANLKVDSAKEAAICEHCGSAFIVEKAINNYNTVNIKADVVNVHGCGASDFVIIAGKLEKYNGVSTEVVIPDNVTIVGENAFSGCVGITNIIIPNSVNKIENYAFQGCIGLAKIVIPDSVKQVLGCAFSGCTNIANIYMSKNVEVIGGSTFQNCENLQNIFFGNSIMQIGMSPFAGCMRLTNINIPVGTKFGCNRESLDSYTMPDNMANATAHMLYEIHDWWSGGERPYPEIVTVNGKKISEQIIRSLYEEERNREAENSQNKSGCYIATAVYGSYDCPQVWTLRRYRDESLTKTWYGKVFIRAYYAVSPIFVKIFGKTKWFKQTWKVLLDIFVKRLNDNGVNNTHY